ncbi:hypothetical protein D9M69_615520 [compost metagenome]
MFAILHGWRLEGMAASIHKTFGDHPCRSELARDEPENAAGCQASRVIVDDHRERARSYKGLRCASEPHGIPQRVVSNPSHKPGPQRVGDDVSGCCFQIFFATQGPVEVTLLP